MNLHEATEVDIETRGDTTYVSICANCNMRIERAEYHDEDRGYYLAKHWSVVTRGIPARTAGMTYARFNDECLPVLN